MAETARPPKRPRDERLDLFRGLTMLIIFVAHVPANSWNAWIPARFGFSSGAELFVFCSGFASALAFGATFVRRGWWLGTARILQRPIDGRKGGFGSRFGGAAAIRKAGDDAADDQHEKENRESQKFDHRLVPLLRCAAFRNQILL